MLTRNASRPFRKSVISETVSPAPVPSCGTSRRMKLKLSAVLVFPRTKSAGQVAGVYGSGFLAVGTVAVAALAALLDVEVVEIAAKRVTGGEVPARPEGALQHHLAVATPAPAADLQRLLGDEHQLGATRAVEVLEQRVVHVEARESNLSRDVTELPAGLVVVQAQRLLLRLHRAAGEQVGEPVPVVVHGRDAVAPRDCDSRRIPAHCGSCRRR